MLKNESTLNLGNSQHSLGKETHFFIKLNVKWGTSWPREKWQNLWIRIWKSDLFVRDKPDFGESSTTAYVLGKDYGWTRLLHLLRRVQPEPVRYGNPIVFLDDATQQSALKLPLLLLFVSQTRTAWRCTRVFQQSRRIAPTTAILSECLQIGKEIVKGIQSADKLAQAEVGLAYLQLMKEAVKVESRQHNADYYRLEGPPSSEENSPLVLPSPSLSRNHSATETMEYSFEEIGDEATQTLDRNAANELTDALAQLGVAMVIVREGSVRLVEGADAPIEPEVDWVLEVTWKMIAKELAVLPTFDI
ncbi:hypothetical protein R1sor_014820 [Riccia sorocarpa]|uniref:Uncharacterized protein n=1 Tax=Riccia sorocarpa TaxID=122646 RepID=A0ABD3HEQ1_9MARC